MTCRIKKRHPALRHAGYSVTTILPGENAAEFEKLHRDLISEWSPDGTLDEETVATLARLVWRRRNLHTFHIAELARKHVAKLQESMVPDPDLPGSAPRPSSTSYSSKNYGLQKARRGQNLATFTRSWRWVKRRQLTA